MSTARAASILVAEDNRALREAVTSAVRGAGFQVAVVGDGAAAVHAEADELHGAWERELLERLKPEPDRVVSACRKAADALWGFLGGFSSPAPAKPVALLAPA